MVGEISDKGSQSSTYTLLTVGHPGAATLRALNTLRRSLIE